MKVMVRFAFFNSLFCVLASTFCVTQPFKLGLENISDSFLRTLGIKGSASSGIGLITNQTGIDQEGRRNIDLLPERGVRVAYIFAPEHGFDGSVAAEHQVADAVDKKTNIPIISLYGKGSGKSIERKKLQNISALFFDMQDVGMRHFTYISTLLYAMKSAAEHDKPIVVLDRPNLLGGIMEGPLVDSHYVSFASIAPIPLRHGMTIGELAWYFNAHVLANPAKLYVVTMHNYDRYAPANSDLFAPLSPHIQTRASSYGYSFLGLLGEVRPLDVGLGTDKSFQVIALPDTISFSNQQWHALKALLGSLGIESSLCRYFSKRRRRHCNGLHLHIDTMHTVAAFDALITTLSFFKAQGIKLSFSQLFDKAVGTSRVRAVIEGKQQHNSLKKEIATQLQGFMQKARDSFLYEPWPQVFFQSE